MVHFHFSSIDACACATNGDCASIGGGRATVREVLLYYPMGLFTQSLILCVFLTILTKFRRIPTDFRLSKLFSVISLNFEAISLTDFDRFQEWKSPSVLSGVLETRICYIYTNLLINMTLITVN